MYSDDAATRMIAVERFMRALVLGEPGEAGEAAAAHLSAGGSRVRARIALHACRALRVPEEQAIAAAAACELLHNASLVHDDLQDRDPTRRGQASIWHRYGDAAAICVGDLFLSGAYAALSDTGAAARLLITRMHRRVAEVIRGQCADLALRGAEGVSVATYEAMARGKSGPLLILPLEFSLVLGGRFEAIDAAVTAGSFFAVGYQAADDLEDVERDAVGKEVNLVAVLAAGGESLPREAARQLAIERFDSCVRAAALLPEDCGGLLASQARRRAAALSNIRAAA